MKVKVLDGRDVNALPHVEKLKIRNIDIIARFISPANSTDILCLMLDGKLTPCVRMPCAEYEFILCPAYKTPRGFRKWLSDIYPDAEEL